MTETKHLEPVSVDCDAPDNIIILDQASVDRLNAILDRAREYHGMRIDDDDTFALVDQIVASGTAEQRALEKDRVRTKAPFLNAGRDIDAAAKTIDTEIAAVLDPLAVAMSAYQRRKKVEAERVERERQRQIEEAQRRQLEAESLPVSTPEDLAVREDLVDEVAVVELVQAPTEIKSHVRTQVTMTVEVFDYSMLPGMVNGVQIVEPKVAAIKKLLECNVEVPGARLVAADKVVRRAR